MPPIRRVPLTYRDPATGKVRREYKRLPHGYREGQGGAFGSAGIAFDDGEALRAQQDEFEREKTHWKAREADLLKRIETLERRMDDLAARVGGLEDRPPQEMPKSVAGEMTVLRDRLAHLTSKHGADILELQKALAVLGNAAAAHMQQG